MTELVEKMRKFLGFNKNALGDNQSESSDNAPDNNKIGFLNDVCFENKVLNRCGVGLSEEEAFLVHTSVKSFNKLQSANKTRFWGKIFGLERDYYVIETETEEKEADDENNLEVVVNEVPGREEGRGHQPQGILGQHGHYEPEDVGQTAFDHAPTAPRVKEHQVHLQRGSRKENCSESYFLWARKAHGGSFEIFLAKSTDYQLKAQIVRISHGTHLIPRGILTVRTENDSAETDESKDDKVTQKLEDQEVDPVEEIAPQKIPYYKKSLNWVHSEQCDSFILSNRQPYWTRGD